MGRVGPGRKILGVKSCERWGDRPLKRRGWAINERNPVSSSLLSSCQLSPLGKLARFSNLRTRPVMWGHW
jgi:hypothetical protein